MLSARKIVGPEANSAIALHRLMRLVHVRIGLGRLGQAVVDLGAQVAGGAGVELLLGHAALLVVANDLELVHVVGLLGKEGLHLVLEHPPAGLPDVLVHGRAHRADHPAVAVAMADLRADPLRLVGVPELVPRLVIEIAHDLLVLGAVAGHDVAVGIDKEGVERHVAGQQARLAVDVVEEAGISDRVDFVGFVKGEEKERLIDGAACVLCPSTWFENMPNTVLEAYAHSKPVVVFDIGCMPELVENGETGSVLPLGDVDALSKTIAFYLENPDEVRRQGMNGRNAVLMKYTPQNHLEKLEAILDPACAKKED